MYNMSKKLDENEIQLEREIALDILERYYISTIIETDEICLFENGIYKRGFEVYGLF